MHQLETEKCRLRESLTKAEVKIHGDQEVISRLKRNIEAQKERVYQLEQQQQQALENSAELQRNFQVYRSRIIELTLQDATDTNSAANAETLELHSWVVSKSEITITDEEIGRGAWGSVNVALFRGKKVAAKMMHQLILCPRNISLFAREMYLSSTLRHPNLVMFIGATIEGEAIILTELMETSLGKLLEQNPEPKPLPKSTTTSILRDVAMGLNYLHLKKPEALVHRDVSSANVLLEESARTGWKAKLSDFGTLNFSSRLSSVSPGNSYYAAPEASNPPEQSPKMDVFSYGVLAVEMCTGAVPSYEPMERKQTIAKIQWRAAVDLIKQCTYDKKEKRPSMEDILMILDSVAWEKGLE